MSSTKSSSNIPCRFYNHDGCFRDNCRFSHQPDHKSIQDARNKNVCKYYILGECRYEAQCVYSHDRTYLDEDPSLWWNDPNPKAALKAASSSSRPSGSGQSGSPQVPAQAHRNDRKGGNRFSGRQREQVRAGRKKAALGGPRSSPGGIDFDDDERMMNGGFSNDELNELLSYGVKPWDEDAWEVLFALRGDY